MHGGRMSGVSPTACLLVSHDEVQFQRCQGDLTTPQLVDSVLAALPLFTSAKEPSAEFRRSSSYLVEAAKAVSPPIRYCLGRVPVPPLHYYCGGAAYPRIREIYHMDTGAIVCEREAWCFVQQHQSQNTASTKTALTYWGNIRKKFEKLAIDFRRSGVAVKVHAMCEFEAEKHHLEATYRYFVAGSSNNGGGDDVAHTASASSSNMDVLSIVLHLGSYEYRPIGDEEAEDSGEEEELEMMRYLEHCRICTMWSRRLEHLLNLTRLDVVAGLWGGSESVSYKLGPESSNPMRGQSAAERELERNRSFFTNWNNRLGSGPSKPSHPMRPVVKVKLLCDQNVPCGNKTRPGDMAHEKTIRNLQLHSIGTIASFEKCASSDCRRHVQPFAIDELDVSGLLSCKSLGRDFPGELPQLKKIHFSGGSGTDLAGATWETPCSFGEQVEDVSSCFCKGSSIEGSFDLGKQFPNAKQICYQSFEECKLLETVVFARTQEEAFGFASDATKPMYQNHHPLKIIQTGVLRSSSIVRVELVGLLQLEMVGDTFCFGCKFLQSVVLDDLPKLERIEADCFAECNALTTVAMKNLPLLQLIAVSVARKCPSLRPQGLHISVPCNVPKTLSGGVCEADN